MPILTTHELLHLCGFEEAAKTMRESKLPIRILDLDNCISNDGWRIDRIDWNSSDPNGKYAVYHELCPFDAIGNERLFESPAHNVIFTGRPLRMQHATAEWLNRNNVVYTLAMFRPDLSKLRSVDLKEKMLRGLLVHIGAHGVQEAFDDRADIIQMYKSNGIFNAQQVCLHNVDAYRMPDGSDIDAERRAA